MTIDHIETARELMLSQFNESDDLQALLRSWLTPLQELEDSLQEFLSSNRIDVGYGVILDIIGSWMGVERGFREDEEYRQAILGEGLIENADGSVGSIYSILDTLTGRPEYVDLFESPVTPPTLYPYIGANWNKETYNQCNRIKVAGVNLVLLADYGYDSMRMGEVSAVCNALVDHTGEEYCVQDEFGNQDTLITGTPASAVFTEDGTPMSELVGGGEAMAEILNSSLSIVDGGLVDINGSPILDSSGNQILEISYGE